MGRFETGLLARDVNVEALTNMSGAWINRVHDRRPPKMIILDMDSSVGPTHGEQEGTEPAPLFPRDAAFASPDLYEFLEGENYKYVIRLKANKILQECIAHLLTRPVGRPPRHVRRYYASSSYQAGLWNKKRRVENRVSENLGLY